MRTIDADALCEEFKRRQRAALRWKEKAILADDEEIKIRADAVLAFLSEVKLTIDNAPTVEQPTGEWIDYSDTFYKCPECGYLLEKYCPRCQNKVILPKGGETNAVD